MNIKRQLTISNLLTIIRLLCIPYMVKIILENNNKWFAFAVFCVLWSTDFLDGYIAHRFNQVSELGMRLDPLVDKIFQLSLAISMYIIGKLPLWIVVFILVKEALMIYAGVRIYKRNMGPIQAKWYGKITTVLYAAAFAILFFLNADDTLTINLVFLPAIIFAVISFVGYTCVLLKKLRENQYGN